MNAGHRCALNPLLSCSFGKQYRDFGYIALIKNKRDHCLVYSFAAKPVRTAAADQLELWDID